MNNKINSKNPIGVFDSGIGGLTVLKQLAQDFPNEDFIYIADTDFCPYGMKEQSQIEDRVLEIGKKLIEFNVKTIVIACNTATANASKLIEAANVDVIGVIEPTAKMAYKVSKNKHIAIIATNLTTRLGSYQRVLERYKVVTFPLPASRLVEIVEEEDLTNQDNVNKITVEIDQILTPLKNKNIDTIIYGCTHFGLLDSIIGKIFPEVNRIECGIPTSNLLRTTLNSKRLLNTNTALGTITLYDTHNDVELKNKIGWFDAKYNGPFLLKIE